MYAEYTDLLTQAQQTLYAFHPPADTKPKTETWLDEILAWEANDDYQTDDPLECLHIAQELHSDVSSVDVSTG